jgi:F-type H+-transporting ATPase subunit delta
MSQPGSESIARPYARAIFELAQRGNTQAEWLSLLGSLSTILDDAALNSYLSNPKTTKASKAMAIREVLKDIKQDTSNINMQWSDNLLVLLIENQRLSSISHVASLYKQLLDQSLSRISVEIQTAAEPDRKALTEITKKLEAHYQSNVEISNTLNPELLGGAKVKVNNTVIDGSIKNKLNKLTTWLIK